MKVAGLIFSNVHDGNLPELTAQRTMASVPFGCRYRLIDFALSNMVNSDITNIGIITTHNYQSLLDHIGMGTDWDLARRSGGIKILPPNITAFDNPGGQTIAHTRLESLMGALNFIGKAKEDYIVLSDCDVICNIDLSDMIDFHVANNADITFAVKTVNAADHKFSKRVRVVDTDENGKVLNVENYSDQTGDIAVSTNVFVMKRKLLQTLVIDAQSKGYTDFYRDIISKNLDNMTILAYNYEGYYSLINNLAGYFDCNMKLLDGDARRALFGIEERPVHTKVRNSAPAKYCDGASVKNSVIADGCIIEGTVENSIVFRGVKVGKGTVVKNCILLQDTYVGSHVSLNCVVTDKNVVIKDDRTLSGHQTMPFFIGKGLSI